MRQARVDIDDEMLTKAREILGTNSIQDTVDEALLEVVRHDAGKRLIAWLKENEDLRNPEIMRHAWPLPAVS
jgi:Arc/MetJ family transcription regulator